jgi:thiosulfate dehydrogenase [quinone] large subunit
MATTTRTAAPETTVLTGDDLVARPGARRLLAVARLSVGFVFLWAFLDKTFGLKYSTGWVNPETGSASAAWIDGGTPSQGFMKFAAIGPFKDLFNSMASPVTDWLFMLGMLAVGVAVMLGIGLRVAACAGSLIMLMMWLAEWPLQQGSTNPVMDYHVVYALVIIFAAVTLAGDTWGLGKWWANLPVVKKNPWLR